MRRRGQVGIHILFEGGAVAGLEPVQGGKGDHGRIVRRQRGGGRSRSSPALRQRAVKDFAGRRWLQLTPPLPGVVIAIWHHAANGWAWRVQRTLADGRMMLMVPSGEVRVMVAPDGDLLMPRDGETWADFQARRIAAGRGLALQPSSCPPRRRTGP